jgi:metal-responsive CopG/Arc/MetJ family transcriptional regulator
MTPIRRNTTIRLDDDLYAGMQAIWARDGVQPSEQIRRALRAWLESKGVLKQTAPRRVAPRRKA